MNPSPPPVELVPFLAAALLNPAMLAVAIWMGRRADQPAKFLVAGFAAAAAGALLLGLAIFVGVPGLAALRRSAAGIFALQVLAGTLIAAFARRLAHKGP